MSKIKSAEEFFIQEWGTGFIRATLSEKNGLLDMSMEDIYSTMQKHADYVLKAKLESITDEVKKIQENLILIIEGFQDAKENYGYDLANETYYIEEIIQSTKAIKYKTKTIKR